MQRMAKGAYESFIKAVRHVVKQWTNDSPAGELPKYAVALRELADELAGASGRPTILRLAKNK